MKIIIEDLRSLALLSKYERVGSTYFSVGNCRRIMGNIFLRFKLLILLGKKPLNFQGYSTHAYD